MGSQVEIRRLGYAEHIAEEEADYQILAALRITCPVLPTEYTGYYLNGESLPLLKVGLLPFGVTAAMSSIKCSRRAAECASVRLCNTQSRAE